MPERTVLASRAADGHLELREPVELPSDREFTVTLHLPEEELPEQAPGQKIDLPVWRGNVLGRLTRDEIYDELG